MTDILKQSLKILILNFMDIKIVRKTKSPLLVCMFFLMCILFRFLGYLHQNLYYYFQLTSPLFFSLFFRYLIFSEQVGPLIFINIAKPLFNLKNRGSAKITTSIFWVLNNFCGQLKIVQICGSLYFLHVQTMSNLSASFSNLFNN